MLTQRIKTPWAALLIAGLAAGCQSSAPPSQPAPADGSLLEAVARDDDDAALRLIRKGADLNESVPQAAGEDRLTPLMIAVVNGNTRLVRILLNHGATLHQTASGYSAVDLARYLNEEEILDVFERKQKGLPMEDRR